MTYMRRILRSQSGATAAEFTLVVPLLIFFLFALIDAGRFIWTYNQAEKATQMGVRYAVATAMVTGDDFADYSFSIDGGVAQGAPVPVSEFDSAVCDNTDCTCTGGDVCDEIAYDGDAFANIVERAQLGYSRITPANVEVEYRNIGLGYAGDPNGPDVAPLVTVRLTAMQFQPLFTMIFGLAFPMHDFSAALTLEDGAGAVAN